MSWWKEETISGCLNIFIFYLILSSNLIFWLFLFKICWWKKIKAVGGKRGPSRAACTDRACCFLHFYQVDISSLIFFIEFYLVVLFISNLLVEKDQSSWWKGKTILGCLNRYGVFCPFFWFFLFLWCISFSLFCSSFFYSNCFIGKF